MAYRMLSGRVLFDGNSPIEILHKHCMEPPPRWRRSAWGCRRTCTRPFTGPSRRNPSSASAPSVRSWKRCGTRLRTPRCRASVRHGRPPPPPRPPQAGGPSWWSRSQPRPRGSRGGRVGAGGQAWRSGAERRDDAHGPCEPGPRGDSTSHAGRSPSQGPAGAAQASAASTPGGPSTPAPAAPVQPVPSALHGPRRRHHGGQPGRRPVH